MTAKIYSQIAQIEFRRRKLSAAKHKKTYDCRNQPFEHIEEQREQAEFQPEIAAHIERSGIAASHLPNIAFLQF